MPTTSHGREVLEKAWRDVTHAGASPEKFQGAIAVALVSIALSLRIIAANYTTGLRR